HFRSRGLETALQQAPPGARSAAVARAGAKDAAGGIVVVSPNGVIEDVDDAVCDLLGYGRDEGLGLHGADLLPPDARPRTAGALDRMRRGEVTRREGRVRRKDGTDVLVDVECRALPGGWLVLGLRRRSGA